MEIGEIVKLPFVQVALPIMVTFIIGFWQQNRRVDDVNRRLDEIVKRLDRIELKLENHNERIARLEERSSPITGIRR